MSIEITPTSKRVLGIALVAGILLMGLAHMDEAYQPVSAQQMPGSAQGFVVVGLPISLEVAFACWSRAVLCVALSCYLLGLIWSYPFRRSPTGWQPVDLD